MDDLTAFTAFCEARLREDEAAAKAAPGEHWQSFTEDDIAGASVYDEQWVLLYPQHYDHNKPLSAKPGATGPAYIEQRRDELVAHIARHDPARVLREVAAKRKRLALYLDAKETLAAALREAPPEDDPATAHSYVRERINVNNASGRFIALEMSVRLDVMVWSDHPDYDPSWAPDGNGVH